MKKLRVAITSGDTDGIGLEIVQKALSKISLPKDIQLLIFKNETNKLKLPKKYSCGKASSLSEAFAKFDNDNSDIIEISSSISPALWVEAAAKYCLQRKIHSIVTGPLSKSLILSSGLKDIGHTDILKRIAKKNSAYMAFLGKKFNVLLATSHIPLNQVERHLSIDSIKEAVLIANEYKFLLSKNRQCLPIGILGLNPHSGDDGLLGDFENAVLKPSIKALSTSVSISGPIVPDVAFQPQNWKKFSFYIALYHDQGLIPFKMAHGFNGAHLTLGLPILRSSVDHGTAKDIFAKNCADPQSMIEAIKWGFKLARLENRKG